MGYKFLIPLPSANDPTPLDTVDRLAALNDSGMPPDLETLFDAVVRSLRPVREDYDIIKTPEGYQVIKRFGPLVGEIVCTTTDIAEALSYGTDNQAEEGVDGRQPV